MPTLYKRGPLDSSRVLFLPVDSIQPNPYQPRRTFEQEDLDGLENMKVPQSLLDQALETIQSLDPPGVGARSLSECLLLQLSRQKHPSPVVMDIVARFLPELGRKHYGPIARELGIPPTEILLEQEGSWLLACETKQPKEGSGHV